MTEWQDIRIGDLGRVVTGKTPPTSKPEYYGGTTQFLTPTDMDGRRIINQTLRYLSEEGENKVSSSLLPKGSVSVSCIGSDMGKTVLVGKKSVTNQQINSVIVEDKFDNLFVYYNLSGRKSELQFLASGAAQPIMNKTDFSNLTIKVPPLNIQRTIASVLGALDDKIENNRRMNETLEEMARVIFKSWFVDFDPVHAKVAGNAPTNMKAEIAALFPNSFSDDGLPLGWVNNELSNVCSLLGGYAFKSQEFVNEGMPVVKIKNITGNGDVSLKDCQFIDSKSTNGKDKFKLEDGDLLIAMTGATVGKTGIITDGKMTPYLNQRVGKFVPKHSFYKWAIWAYLQFKKNVDAVVATGTGSAQTNISSPGIMSVKWTEAPHEIYKVFDEIVSPYFNLWISNRHQNQTLTELRDTLLPKLMSGEIRVKDAQNKVEAAV